MLSHPQMVCLKAFKRKHRNKPGFLKIAFCQVFLLWYFTSSRDKESLQTQFKYSATYCIFNKLITFYWSELNIRSLVIHVNDLRYGTGNIAWKLPWSNECGVQRHEIVQKEGNVHGVFYYFFCLLVFALQLGEFAYQSHIGHIGWEILGKFSSGKKPFHSLV